MFENFVSYKTDERQMISDTSTIEDTVEAGSNITITETEQSKLEEQIDTNVKHQITIDCTDKENNNCKAHGKTVFAVTSEID